MLYRILLLVIFVLGCEPAGVQIVPDEAEQPEPSIPPYHREAFGDWVDADHDCQNTRQEVLIAESLEPVVFDEHHCKVKSGRWICPYTGHVFTDPKQLDIDHLVPLAEAHRTGAWAWDRAKKEHFANNLDDQDALVAVSAAANRAKGDNTPAQWMPTNVAFRCRYLTAWTRIKSTWSLRIEPAEQEAITSLRVGSRCEKAP